MIFREECVLWRRVRFWSALVLVRGNSASLSSSEASQDRSLCFDVDCVPVVKLRPRLTADVLNVLRFRFCLRAARQARSNEKFVPGIPAATVHLSRVTKPSFRVIRVIRVFRGS